MKTVEELLRPRYKCIAPYPCSDFTVGAVIELEEKVHPYDGSGELVWQTKWIGESRYYEYYFSQYPNIFQPLPWWSDREVSDMPEYVKHVNGSVHKVITHGDNGARLEGSYWAVYKNLTPATLADYNEYLQQKG